MSVYLSFFPFALHIRHADTVPEVFWARFFTTATAIIISMVTHWKCFAAFEGSRGEDNKREREEEGESETGLELFFSFSAVFQPSVVHPCFKSITHTYLRVPRSHQTWNWVNVIFLPVPLSERKKNRAVLSKIIRSNNMSDFSVSEQAGTAARLPRQAVFINSG